MDISAKEETISSKDTNQVVKAKILGDEVIPIAKRNIVGYCHNKLHPGKLTKKILAEHDCLGKQCRYLEKHLEAGYWENYANMQQHKEKLKQKKAKRKQQEQAAAERFEELRILFQSYADESGYPLQVVRVDELHHVLYIYYVSDYPYADGNRFPELIKSVRFFFPRHKVVLRHIMDANGHFVTRAEFRHIKR